MPSGARSFQFTDPLLYHYNAVFFKETNGDATLRFLTAQPTTLPRIEKKNGICSVSQQHFNT
jgi:hypothetical protein